MLPLKKPLILASNSPRRKQLLQDAGFEFTVNVLPTDESYPAKLSAREVAAHISHQKAEKFRGQYDENLVLTADTVVICGQQILGKPVDEADAFRMLRMISGKTHLVVTAVSLLSGGNIKTVADTARVYFRDLEDWEINYYIERCKPFDKAGSYGIQEWIGMVGIEKIEGSYYTIMGLPVQVVYQLLKPHFR